MLIELKSEKSQTVSRPDIHRGMIVTTFKNAKEMKKEEMQKNRRWLKTKATVQPDLTNQPPTFGTPCLPWSHV
ncbi:MAG: hypothetical protein HQL84_13320 [Magnetococcales bacterium]|nr:hypothetical protein [Magnetococcales bacterium]MBF0151014.1 hypothetical protein [Magnetococcales bacterium]MBF0172712.1 hypothetical protein [Magnetococcales bacterium]MBF0347797.1 hypothetical protein [Magnetococcales bacterium]MBF0629426.1 hypothetical protein [Magnetococcales bacterium]